MFDSPFVRRVAVTMNLLAMPFEHRNWSVGKNFDRIREFNPLGRVPTLVLDDGESLIESATILDYLDDFVGPARSLLPPAGRDRREAARPATPGERGAVLELLLGAPAPRPTGIRYAVPAARKPWVAIHGYPCDACVAPACAAFNSACGRVSAFRGVRVPARPGRCRPGSRACADEWRWVGCPSPSGRVRQRPCRQPARRSWPLGSLRT